MQVESHTLNDLHALRYAPDDQEAKCAGEAKKQDPLNTWSYDLASWVSNLSYEPPQPLSENKKPVLYSAGADDPNIPDGVLEILVAEIGGPVTLDIVEGAGHQLMLFNTKAYSDSVHAFCLENS